MKAFLTLSLIALTLAPTFAQARGVDPCEEAAYEFAVKQQHKDYPGRSFERHLITRPNIEANEQLSRGFESWNVSYGVDEECGEGYTLLMRRSNDGDSCAAIKITDEIERDCG